MESAVFKSRSWAQDGWDGTLLGSNAVAAPSAVADGSITLLSGREQLVQLPQVSSAVPAEIIEGARSADEEWIGAVHGPARQPDAFWIAAPWVQAPALFARIVFYWSSGGTYPQTGGPLDLHVAMNAAMAHFLRAENALRSGGYDGIVCRLQPDRLRAFLYRIPQPSWKPLDDLLVSVGLDPALA